MNEVEVKFAKLRALNIFNKWNDEVGVVPVFSEKYFDLQDIIVDAVYCGIQQTLGDFEFLESEKNK